jgi:hypothetical protein
MNWTFLLPLAVMAYLMIRMISLSKRNALNRKMLNVLDTFNSDQEGKEFFERCDSFLATETDIEFLNKVRVLRLWGDVYHDRREDFRRDLEQLDLSKLIMKTEKGKTNIELNEDSFFYLYLAIPNRFFYSHDTEDAALFQEKMETIRSEMGNRLVVAVGDANRAFYEKGGDTSRDFYKKLLDGDYGEYSYAKEMIGIYKNIASCMAARIALNLNDQADYDEYVPDLKNFAKSNLGRRYEMELGITLPEEPEEKDDEAKEAGESEPQEDAETKAEEAKPAEAPAESEKTAPESSEAPKQESSK